MTASDGGATVESTSAGYACRAPTRPRDGGPSLVEPGNHLLDLEPGVADAVAAEADQLGGPGHLRGEHVDVDVGPLELGQDGFELGEGGGVASGHGFGSGHGSGSCDRVASTVLVAEPRAKTVTSWAPPIVHVMEDGNYVIQGKRVSDQPVLSEMAIPAGEEPPFVADLATTTAANGKLEILQRKNEAAPLGWIQDKEGRLSTDPHELKNGGALLPLGGSRDHGSHKGYALGAVVDIFSAVLSGANYGPWVPPFPAYVPMPTGMPGKGIGHFFGAMRIDAFRPAPEFKSHMDHWIRRFRAAKPVPGQARVLIPGDPEREIEEERRKTGIPLLLVVVEDLKKVAEKLGVDPL